MASNKKRNHKHAANAPSAVSPRIDLFDVFSLSGVILFTLCLGISSISGWIVANGEAYGGIPLALYLGCAALAFLTMGLEYLLRRTHLTPFILRVAHFGLTTVIYYVFMGILSGTGTVTFNLLSVPGILISFLLLALIYFAFFGLFCLVRLLKSRQL